MQPKESNTNSHFYISLLKSAIRIVACYFLYVGNISVAALLFGTAEVLGVIEEI